MEIVTVSANKTNGDRSYMGGVWQVLGRNGVYVSLWRLDRTCISESFGGKKRPWLLIEDEYDFHDARPLLDRELLNRCLSKAKMGLPAPPEDQTVVVNITS